MCTKLSEGRDLERWKIIAPFRAKRMSSCSTTALTKTNRRVVTVTEHSALKDAVIEAMGIAAEVIDMTKTRVSTPHGSHRCGAFIPRGCTIEDADKLASMAAAVADRFGIPSFLTSALPVRLTGQSCQRARASLRAWPKR